MNKNDERIRSLMARVEFEKEKLGQRPRISLSTNGIFKYENGEHFNLNTINNAEVFVSALGYLLSVKSSREEAAKRLGFNDYKFEWGGFSIEEWEDDFRLRLEVINWHIGQKKLEVLEKRLSTLISKDAKTQLALDDIEKSLA